MKRGGPAMSLAERILPRRGHDARAVANELIRKGVDDGRPITPLQVMKVLYFCHGWSLAQLGRPLVRQSFEVWRFGPVVRDVYHALKHHGRERVRDPIPGFDMTEFPIDEREVIDKVFADHGHVNGLVLSYLTHVPGGPWDTVRMSKGEGVRIPNQLIRDYFMGYIAGRPRAL